MAAGGGDGEAAGLAEVGVDVVVLEAGEEGGGDGG